jgi:hypothetical protein
MMPAMSAATVRIRLNGRQPRHLASLMDLYQTSYERLMRLVPDLPNMQGVAVSRVAGALDLHLVVLEQCPYTTTMLLTYRFPEEGGAVLEPEVMVRAYHDARLAEVLAHHRRRARRPGDAAPEGGELERRWEMNRFLHRWLGYCQRQGHLFLRYSGCAPAAAVGEALPG